MPRLGILLLCSINAISAFSCESGKSKPDGPAGRDDCKPPVQPKADDKASPLLTVEDRALLDILRARELARARLRAVPGDFIRGEVKGTQNTGFFGPRTQVTTIAFKNESPFDVSDLKGHIRFSEGAQYMGSLPFVASGLVNAGEAAVIDVQSGDLTGKATRSDVVIDSVHVRN